MADIAEDIRAFDSMTDRLSKHVGQWAVIYNRELIGLFESFESAADEAVRQFGSGPYLIRRVGAHRLTLPVSVMYHFSNAQR